MALVLDTPPARTGALTAASRAEEDRYLLDTFRRNARTFSLAARLLPPRVRVPVATLYLYCRTIDEIADRRPLEIGLEGARAELDDASDALDDALAGRTSGGAPLLWRRLAELRARFDLPAGPFRQLVDGARWDLDGRPIGTEADLLAYSDLVAGSVGAMMLPFLEPEASRRPALVGPARALGSAMQLTNILRDVGEDRTRLGRVYLPADALSRVGLCPEDLDGPALNGHRTRYGLLCEELMAVAERLYAEARAGILALPGTSRAAIVCAARMYREILNEVRAAGYDNLSRRAVVPLQRKLRAVAGGYDGRRDRLVGRDVAECLQRHR